MKMSNVKQRIGWALLVVTLSGCLGVWWGYAHLTSLVTARLKVLVGPDISMGKVTARWNRIELDQVRIVRHGSGPFAVRWSCRSIVIRLSLLSLFSDRLDISDVLLDKPYLLLEINPDGSLAKIVPALPALPAAFPPVRIAALRMKNGSLDLLDRQIARKKHIGVSNPREGYHLTSYQDLSLSAGALDLPLSGRPTHVRLELTAKGGGHLQITGDIAPKGLDSTLKLNLTGLNITRYRPYFLKPGDLDISVGTLSATSTISIHNRVLNAPGSLHLKGLAFDHSSAKGVLLGVPSWALVTFLSDNKGELSASFAVNGNLDNPRFSIQQSLVNQIATALSSKIGVPTVSDVGKGILGIGEKGVKGLFGITGTKK